MPKDVMRRRAADNEHYHADFHGALSAGIEYLDSRLGLQAVREYLRQFANAYYAPLKADIRRRGLPAIRDHYEKVYRREGGRIDVEMSPDELVIRVRACPAVTHMRSRRYAIARAFSETTRTVNEALCEGAAFAAELDEYDDRTGQAVVRFRRVRP